MDWILFVFVAPTIALFLIVLRQNHRLRLSNRRLVAREAELTHHAEVDPLTGLQNRLYLAGLRDADQEISGAVAVLDIDDFKLINDELGHMAGDEVLRSVGDLLRASIRKQDLACRWGGDEFILYFQNEKIETAEKRLRQIEGHLWRFRLRNFGLLPLRTSWGVIETKGRSLSDALAAADEEMYRMKRDRKPKTTDSARRAIIHNSELLASSY